jgi:hypothetical protein
MGIESYSDFKTIILKRIENNESDCQNAMAYIGICYLDNQGNIIDYDDLLYKLHKIYKSLLIVQVDRKYKIDISFIYLIDCLVGERNCNNFIFNILEKYDRFNDIRKCEFCSMLCRHKNKFIRRSNNMYEWKVELLFKSGISQTAFAKSECDNSLSFIKELMQGNINDFEGLNKEDGSHFFFLKGEVAAININAK